MRLSNPEGDMLQELDRFERLMPKYKDSLREISKVIRIKIWPVSDVSMLSGVLNALNFIFEVVVSSSGEQLDFIEWYVVFLQKYSNRYTEEKMLVEFSAIIESLKQRKTQEIIKLQWERINPYFRDQFVEDVRFEKNIIQILEEVFSNVISVYPDNFFVELGKIKNITRGRHGEWCKTKDLLPPSIAIAKANNSLNRWNPSDKRYLYLARSDVTSSVDNEFICFEEMRSQIGQLATFIDFSVASIAKKKVIINLDYEMITRKSLIKQLEGYGKDLFGEVLAQMLRNDSKPTRSNIDKAINERNLKTYQEVSVFCGQVLLKELCDAIFVPLDIDEDTNPDLKNKCYKSFHILAEYIEKRNIAGIIYPSTRTKLKSVHGQNVVLFDVMDVQPIQNSIRVKTKQ